MSTSVFANSGPIGTDEISENIIIVEITYIRYFNTMTMVLTPFLSKWRKSPFVTRCLGDWLGE